MFWNKMLCVFKCVCVCVHTHACVNMYIHMHMCMNTKTNQYINAQCWEIDTKEDLTLFND